LYISATMESVKDKVKFLPHKPGVYQYFDKNETIIYVGKAKDLYKRVSSYFTKKHEHGKTRLLVSRIVDIQYIVVETEIDALLLENTLIKKYQPRYNVMLKDDKTYPWICIKNERFPRVFSTRRVVKDGSLYFGPYASGRVMKTLLDLIRQLFPLRSCNFKLSQENIDNGKFRICLDYHIGKCLGPCEDKQSEEEYQHSIKQIKAIIKGDLGQVTTYLNEKMQALAENLEFEKAAELKSNLDALKNYQARSTVVSPTVHDVDVFSILLDVDIAYINFMKVMSGAIVQSFTLELKRKLEETEEELLALGMIELRTRFNSTSKEVLTNIPLDLSSDNFTTHVPQRGDKKSLLELSEKNAKFYRMDKLKHEKVLDPERHSKRILSQMQKDLRLLEMPTHIECFDNSNIQGTHPVAACVVFKNAKPSKKDYRHFNIKTVEGPDDFASMEEVVYRRYKRLLDEGESLPQLVVIDGGKGQLSSALKAFDDLGIRGKIAIIGIAKKLEEIFFPGDSLPLYIDKRSETLKIIQYLRNEAHRFGITFHRKIRSKSAISSELLNIKGIGDQTATNLYKHFKSVKKVKEASLSDLEKIIKKDKALLVYKNFNN
jgi:excinuclease ABC subunit C